MLMVCGHRLAREVEIAISQYGEPARLPSSLADIETQNRRPVHDALRRATSDVPLLSARQLDVLQLLADGLDNRAISHQLGISEATTKQCITAILLKLRLTSRLQAGLVGLLALRVGADGLQTDGYSSTSTYEDIAD